VISFIAFVLIAWLIFRALRLKNKHQKQAFELKEQIATVETENRLQGQRLAISRDLHDNIGSQLTFIISSIDNLKYAYQIPDERINQKMDSIADFTRSTITELRDTIWAMNHSNIRFDDIQVRIATYLEKAKSTQENIQFSFNVQDGIPDRIFSSMEGMNCYRIIQEAINNSLKYANASAIDVNISQENSHLVIQISDNGKGFDEKEIEFGNGLRNMQNRAIEMGGTCEIKSEKDKGTVVRLRLPISLEKV
jgi:signal transduction histidine kinase